MDLLSDVLALLKLEGTLYFRTEFSPPWGVAVPEFENVARFHFVHRGRCWLRITGCKKPVLLEQGDLVIITRGSAHQLCDPPDTKVLTVDQVVADTGFTGEGALVLGKPGAGHETQLICGHFAFDRSANHPLLEALPRYIHIKGYADVADPWLEQTLRLIGSEAGRTQLGGDLIALKLSEIIFAQAIRTYLNAQGRSRQVFAGIADPHVSRVLQSIHRSPAHSWTLPELARIAGLSRSAFASRFHELMGMTPLQYLTQWRMQVARRMLVDTDAPMIRVAESSGYQSEASFGRVFKRHFDIAPASYRRVRRNRSNAAPA